MLINPISSGMNGIGVAASSGEGNHRTSANLAGSEAAQTTLSTNRIAVDTLVARALQTSPVREAKLNALQNDVNRGNYVVNPQEVAAAMLVG